MADAQQHIIEPERHGIWIAVTFILALLALVVALVGINRSSTADATMAMEILLLNQKMAAHHPSAAPAQPDATSAAPAPVAK